jgi:hypothetical protein
MPFIHLAEIFQGFLGGELVGVSLAGSYGSNTQRLHLQELVTHANIHHDFAVLCTLLHILLNYILRSIKNTKSDSGDIEDLGKAFFMGAVSGGPVIHHLTKKQEGLEFLRQILFLHGFTVPSAPIGGFDLMLMS